MLKFNYLIWFDLVYLFNDISTPYEQLNAEIWFIGLVLLSLFVYQLLMGYLMPKFVSLFRWQYSKPELRSINTKTFIITITVLISSYQSPNSNTPPCYYMFPQFLPHFKFPSHNFLFTIRLKINIYLKIPPWLKFLSLNLKFLPVPPLRWQFFLNSPIEITGSINSSRWDPKFSQFLLLRSQTFAIPPFKTMFLMFWNPRLLFCLSHFEFIPCNFSPL